ncbi:MAG: hypothetical protein HZY76_11875 [Anaerolineae bacterium]|nr:MAG: hypothetical protein HZY76_11875 [Anaerolineae bacterium]
MALTTGFFSGAGPLIADLLFLVTLIWLAPFSLKAYMTLLGRSPKPAERAFLTASVVLAVIWTAPFFAYSGFGLPVRDMARNLRDGVLFSLLFALVLIPIVLWRGYRSGLARSRPPGPICGAGQQSGVRAANPADDFTHTGR